MEEFVWYDGIDNYKKNQVFFDQSKNQYQHHITLSDVPTQENRSYLEIAHDILSNKGKLEILFSGGIDSEVVLRTAIKLKLSFKVITLKLYVDNMIINTHDLYYSEKICRELGVQQHFVELELKSFFNNGKHIDYLIPYKIIEPHVATHFYLIDQCDNYPIFGGDYSWPNKNKGVLSPHRLWYCSYSRYMQDRNIRGIDNFLNHSLDLNLYLIDKHLKLYDINSNIGIEKSKIFNQLGLGNFEPRFRSYGGYELLPSTKTINTYNVKSELAKIVGYTNTTIFWGSKISQLLGTELYSNNEHF